MLPEEEHGGATHGDELSRWDASHSAACPPPPPLPTAFFPSRKKNEKLSAAHTCDGAPASHPAVLNFGDPVSMEAGDRISEPRGPRLRLVGGTVLASTCQVLPRALSHRIQPVAVGCCLRGVGRGRRGGKVRLSSSQARPFPTLQGARTMGLDVRSTQNFFLVRTDVHPHGRKQSSPTSHAHCPRSVPLLLALCDGSHFARVGGSHFRPRVPLWHAR